ncbi:MAG: NAD-dependent epimerase/dehydratase family protein [Deltaproteobacteria bacterium]|nr:NAD-dependent epimerase/dehydratase family protein [Deltaproteobacteria bacterium]
MKIMVTGGAGFIGSHVVDFYIKEGHQVVVVDNLSTGKRENLNSEAIFYHVDIRSPEIGRIIKKEHVEVLNHHAAQISVPDSVTDPLNDADINIKGFLNLLENSVKNGVRKCIFISSGGAIYGEASQYPTSEDYPPRPLSPYALSKFASEYYLDYYRHQYGLEYTILRYANIYGPRQMPIGEAGVVSIFMTNLVNNEISTLYHFSDDADGMIRDYCYVRDAVRANLLALSKGNGDFFNIGTGRETKTLDLYKMIYNCVKDIKPDISEKLADPNRQKARSGDIPRSCLVVEKARRMLGWIPETGLENGLRLTLKWYVQRFS